MVGDFGEVYVMDWGVAKVLGTGARRRAGKSLTRINDLPAAEFWRKYDRGEFRQYHK